MAKAPLANEPDAPHLDRRTRIASGPAPMPPPTPSLGKPPVPPQIAAQASASGAAAKAALKKTQISMGAPPIPNPAVTGKTVLPSVPKIPAAAKSPVAPKLPPTPTPDASLPSYQETVIGPAPAPPIPSAEKTVVGPAPVPPVPSPKQGKPPTKPEPVAHDPTDAEMDALLADRLFSDYANEGGDEESHEGNARRGDDWDELATALHAPPDAPPHEPKDPDARPRDTLPAPLPVPPRPMSGPAPSAKAAGTRDTMTNAELRGGGSTLPPTNKQGIATTDTPVDLHPEPKREAADRRPTTGVRPVPVRDSRVSTGSIGTDGLTAPAPDAPKLRLTPGKVIPGTRYRILRWLGEGGMGVVYEVEHTDIERRTALKILRLDLSQQPQMAQVFRDEARAVSRLGSPNIVEVYDFGELPDGRLFFAMELLQGQDLVPPDERASMDPARLFGILRQVCKGLARAHQAGVVHRDVKPENIIVSTIEGRADTVKIVDFGISAMLAAGPDRRVGIAGTPHYMAPEQVLGEDFDGRLDVYALGCTAYELLAGKPPFDDEDFENVLKQQVHEAPVPLRQRRPELQIPAELDAVIMRCLAKDPAERFADMADLEAALCEAQIAAGLVTPWDDLPIPPLPDEERRQRIIADMPSRDLVLPPRRTWLWPAVAFTSTLAAAGLAAFVVFGRQPTEEEKDLVEQLTIEARDAASKAAWVIPPPHLESKTTALLKVHELEQLEGSAESMADERAEQLRHEFAITLIDYGDNLWDRARDFSRQYYAWSLIFEQTDQALERAAIDPVTLANFERRALAGEFNDAERLIAGAVTYEVVDAEQKAALTAAMSEGLSKPDSLPPMARAQLERQAKQAGVTLEPARGSGVVGGGSDRSADRAGADDGADEAAAAGEGDDAVLLDENGDPIVGEDAAEGSDAGRRKRRRQVDLGLGKKGKSDPGKSKELTEQGDAKRKQGLRNEAKSLYGQAIAANPSNGSAHLGMALVHFDQSSYHQARKSAEQAVKHSPRNGRAHKVLGDALYKEFHYREAEAAYMEAQRLGVNVGSRLTEVRKKLGK